MTADGPLGREENPDSIEQRAVEHSIGVLDLPAVTSLPS